MYVGPDGDIFVPEDAVAGKPLNVPCDGEEITVHVKVYPLDPDVVRAVVNDDPELPHA